MPTIAAMDLWTCPLGEHPVTRGGPQESPLFLPLPEAGNATEEAPTSTARAPEIYCQEATSAVGRLYCYLFHAGAISELPCPKMPSQSGLLEDMHPFEIPSTSAQTFCLVSRNARFR